MTRKPQIPVVMLLTDQQVGWLNVEPFGKEDTSVKILGSSIYVPLEFTGRRGWIIPCLSFDMLKFLHDTGEFMELAPK